MGFKDGFAGETFDSDISEAEVMTVALVIGGVVTLWWVRRNLKAFGPSFAAQIGLRRNLLTLRQTLIYGAVGFVAVYLFGAFYQLLVIGDDQVMGEAEEIFIAAMSGGPIFLVGLLFLTLTILGPIAEEFVFRGYLQSSLGKHWPAWASTVVVSAFFATVHGTLILWPIYFCLGLLFGVLYQISGSLKVAISAHVINNFVLVSMMLFDVG